MSQVFEHFTIEEWNKLINLFHWSLKSWGLWINIMPNAQSIYNVWYLRYNDITHKTLYTSNSFNQLILNNWFLKNNIIHKNAFIWYNIIKRIIFKISVFFHKVLLLSIWSSLPKIYTMNLISIIRKE